MTPINIKRSLISLILIVFIGSIMLSACNGLINQDKNYKYAGKHKLICYIKDYDSITGTLTFDEVEWIGHTDISRVNDLGLDVETDFPNGYYIHNESEDIKSLKVSDEVEVYIINLNDSDEPFLIDMDIFIKGIPEYYAPYHISIQDDVIIQIREQYIP